MLDVLDDLASRLDAMVRHLGALGLDAGELAALIEMLRDATISADERWTRARDLMLQFMDGRQRQFWKRR
jgi:hypothetical protein